MQCRFASLRTETVLAAEPGDGHLILAGENGIFGYGEIVPDDQTHPDGFNTSGSPATSSSGIS